MRRGIIISLALGLFFAAVSSAQKEPEPYINLIYPKADPTQNSLLLDSYPASGVGSYATPQKPVLLNPASMATVPQTQFAFDHQRYFWGIGDNLYSSSFLYAQHFINRGFGVSLGYFGTEMMASQSIALHYGQRITRAEDPREETNRVGLFGGISIRLRRKGYFESNFDLADPGDPLLANRLAKIAFSGGAGFTYQGEDWRVFIVGDDLNMPNMALETGVTDRLPMQIQAGGEFYLPWGELRANPVLTYHSDYEDFAQDIDPTLTIRKAFMENQLDLSLSGGRWALGMGVYYFLGERSGPGFGYEISMPTAGINSPSHRLAFTYRLSPPPPAYPDLAVDRVYAEGSPIIGGDLTIRAEITNEGVRTASNIPVNLVSEGKSLGIVEIPKLGPKESTVAEFLWQPDDSGDYVFDVRVDDRGGQFPKFESVILELDEANNIGHCDARIYAPPHPTIDAKPPGLMVTQLISVTEDEPVVPLVFFDSADNEVDSRFDTLLSIIGQRLIANPNADVMVEGYFNPGEVEDFAAGSLLAMQRAENVVRKIVIKFPELRERVRISDDHDLERLRAEKEDFEGTRLGKIYTAQENRRAELRVYANPPRNWRLSDRQLYAEDYETIGEKLDNNSLFEVVCIAPDIDSAFAMERNVTDELGTRYRDRVFAREAPGEDTRVVVTAGAILYKPRAFEIPSSELRIEPGFEKTVFDCYPGSESAIKYSNIQVFDDHAKVIWDMEDNEMIESASWDWKVENGKMIEPERIYYAELTVKDEFGQIGESPPETLRVIKSNRRDLSERLILVQFTFAGAYGEPDYASVRMEKLARKVTTRIAQDGSLRVIIGGHTDIVGVESGNIKLSNRRAEEQYHTLRKYMMQILSLNSEDQLDAWLISHNSILSARGYGPSRPYTITRDVGGETKQILIGDNSLPEGRITNRRVEIEFTPRRE